MPTKGERTKSDIVRLSADLLNRQGYLSTPISAVIETTGIQKGGLYRHFDSRDSLAAAALEFAIGKVRARLLDAVEQSGDACGKLLAILNAYGGADPDIPMAGGCPIMNTAIEADQAHAGLRRQARAAMSGWHGLVSGIVDVGMRAGEIRTGVVATDVATAFIACIEGGVMLTQLYGDPAYLNAARLHLASWIERDLRCSRVAGKRERP